MDIEGREWKASIHEH